MTGMTYSGRPVTEGVEFVKVPRADGRGAATRLTRENARTVQVITMDDDTVTLRHKRNGRLTTIRADKFKAWLDKNFDVWLDEVEAAWDREEREREERECEDSRAAKIAQAREIAQARFDAWLDEVEAAWDREEREREDPGA